MTGHKEDSATARVVSIYSTRGDVICTVSVDVDAGTPPEEVLGRAVKDAAARGIDMSHAVLPGVDLGGAHLSGIDFTGAIMPCAKFVCATLEEINFQSASLCGASFRSAEMVKIDFSCADLRGVRLDEALALNGINLTAAKLSKGG